MAKNNESTMMWKVDIAQLKSSMQEAKRSISLANAEFKNATAGMDSWSKSATGVEAKIAQLNKVSESQKSILADLNKQYEITVKEMGEASPEAQRLKVAIENQEAAIKKTEAQADEYIGQLKELKNQEEASKSAMSQLNSTINSQESELGDLKNKYKELVLTQGENSKEAKKLANQITDLSDELADNKATMADVDKAADSLDKSMEEVGDSTNKAGKDAEEASNGGFTVLKGAMANLAAQGVQALASGMANLLGSLVDVGKQALTSYAEYEQLVGGAKKIFDEMDYSQIANDASTAWRDLNMTASEYIEAINLAGASFASTMGDQRGYEVARQGMLAIADYASGTGQNIDELNEKFQLITRSTSSYQSIADQFSGILPQTSADFLAQAQAAGYLSDEYTSLTQVPVAEYQEAVTNMLTQGVDALGLTGNTAAETANTLSGAFAATSATWSNLVTGLADDSADMNVLLDNFISSLLNVANLITPKIKTIVSGMSTLFTGLVQELFPVAIDLINEELPNIMAMGGELLMSLITGITEALPSLLTTAMEIINQLITGLSEAIPQLASLIIEVVPQLIDALMTQLPVFIQGAITFLTSMVQAIPVLVTQLTAALPSVIQTILQGLLQALPTIIQGAITLFNGIVQAIPVIIQSLTISLPQIIDTILNALIEALPMILAGAIQLLMSIVEAIPTIVDSLVENFPQIINQILTSLITALPQVLEAAITLLMALIGAIPTIVTALVSNLPEIITTITSTLVNNLPLVLSAAIELLMGVVQAIPEIITELINNLPEIITTIVDGLLEGVADMMEVGGNLVAGIWDGISGSLDWIKNKITGWVGDVTDFIRDLFGIASPSKLFRDEIGTYLAQGIGVGFENELPAMERSMKDSLSDMVDGLKEDMSLSADDITGSIGINGSGSGSGSEASGGQTINFYQTNNSPKALDNLTVYRETNNLLFSAKVGLSNV